MNAEFVGSSIKYRKKSIYPRKCEKCAKILKTKNTYNKHKKVCGKKKPKYPRTCDSCQKCYGSPASFSRHKKKCGKSFSNFDNHVQVLLTCKLCGVSYSHKQNFKHHVASCTGETNHYFTCVFKECNRSFSRIKLLCRHLFTEHGISSVKDLSFESFSSFQEWLETESIVTFTSFKKLSKKVKADKVYHSYSCQFFKPASYNTLTNRRNKKGTIPRNINCPVRLYAIEESGNVGVFYFSHHNHDITFENCKFQPLRQSVRDTIKFDLMMGVPVQKIREKLQANAGITLNGITYPSKEAFLTCKAISDYKRCIQNSLVCPEERSEIESECNEYNIAPKSKRREKLSESCVSLLDQLNTLLKHPSIPESMVDNAHLTLQTAHMTLQTLVLQCRAAVEN